MVPPEGTLSGGRLLAEITDQIVSAMRKYYGRAPPRAKTYMLDDMVTVVMKDGFTVAEQTAMDAGEPGRVLVARREFQEHIETRYTEIVERLTGRRVIGFMSQAHLAPDVTVEMFMLDGPVPEIGALEVMERAERAESPDNDQEKS